MTREVGPGGYRSIPSIVSPPSSRPFVILHLPPPPIHSSVYPSSIHLSTHSSSSPTHPSLHPCTHSTTDIPIYSPTYSSTPHYHVPVYPYYLPSVHSSTHPPTCRSTIQSAHPCTHPSVYSSTHRSIYPSTHSLSCLFTHPCIHQPTCTPLSIHFTNAFIMKKFCIFIYQTSVYPYGSLGGSLWPFFIPKL